MDGTAGSMGRFPRGKRGLKFIGALEDSGIIRSLPSREAWIEISELIAF